MKYWLLALGIFISAAATAQLGYYVEAGANYADLYITRGAGTQSGKGGAGWQAGGGLEYHTQADFFFFLGGNVAAESFGKDSSATVGLESIISEYSYKPIFLTLPFGVAYQFKLTKTLGLKVFGGITTQVGIGGKMHYHSTVYKKDSATAPVVVVKETNDTHTMRYGRNNNKEYQFDLANANWQFTIGAGLNFNKSMEVDLSYQRGFTNILPGTDASSEVNKLGLLQLNLKLYFPKHYYHTSQEKPYQ